MKGSAHRDGEEQRRLLLNDLPHVAFCKLCALGDLVDDLLVVIGDAEVIGQPFSKLASAASEFTPDGNDLIQVSFLLFAKNARG